MTVTYSQVISNSANGVAILFQNYTLSGNSSPNEFAKSSVEPVKDQPLLIMKIPLQEGGGKDLIEQDALIMKSIICKNVHQDIRTAALPHLLCPSKQLLTDYIAHYVPLTKNIVKTYVTADAWTELEKHNYIKSARDNDLVKTVTTYAIPSPQTLWDIVKESNKLTNETSRKAVALNVSKSVIDCLLKVLRYAASTGFSHGDLHAGNILWDGRQNKFVLIDYGRAFILSDKETTNNIIALPDSDHFIKNLFAASAAQAGSRIYGSYSWKYKVSNTADIPIYLSILSPFTKSIDDPYTAKHVSDELHNRFMMTMDVVGICLWLFIHYMEVFQDACRFITLGNKDGRFGFFIGCEEKDGKISSPFDQFPDFLEKHSYNPVMVFMQKAMVIFCQLLFQFAIPDEIIREQNTWFYAIENVTVMRGKASPRTPICHEGSMMLSPWVWKNAYNTYKNGYWMRFVQNTVYTEQKQKGSGKKNVVSKRLKLSKHRGGNTSIMIPEVFKTPEYEYIDITYDPSYSGTLTPTGVTLSKPEPELNLNTKDALQIEYTDRDDVDATTYERYFQNSFRNSNSQYKILRLEDLKLVSIHNIPDQTIATIATKLKNNINPRNIPHLQEQHNGNSEAKKRAKSLQQHRVHIGNVPLAIPTSHTSRAAIAAGGGSKTTKGRVYIKIRETGRVYWVRKDDKGKKYVVINKKTVKLADIRGKYVYCK